MLCEAMLDLKRIEGFRGPEEDLSDVSLKGLFRACDMALKSATERPGQNLSCLRDGDKALNRCCRRNSPVGGGQFGRSKSMRKAADIWCRSVSDVIVIL